MEDIKEMLAEVEGPDEMLEDLDLFQAWRPYLKVLGDPEKINFHTVNALLQEKGGALGVMQLMNLVISGKQEKTKLTAAKELAYMGGFKPVERSASVNINMIAEAEVDAMLSSQLEELGIHVTDSRHREDDGSAEAEIVGDGDQEAGSF